MTCLMDSGTVLIAFLKKYIDINLPPVAKRRNPMSFVIDFNTSINTKIWSLCIKLKSNRQSMSFTTVIEETFDKTEDKLVNNSRLILSVY